MSQDTARAAVDFFHAAALRGQVPEADRDRAHEYTIIFYGGEPALNSCALEVAARHARGLEFPGRLQLALVTNGTQLDAETIAIIKTYDIGVSVSLDGPADLTDQFRNKGTYSRALNGFARLKDAGISPGISCTLPPESLARFGEITDWLESLAVSNIGFNLVTKPAVGYERPEYHREGTKLLLQAFRRFRERGIYEDRIMRKLRAFVEHRVYPFDCAACGGAQIVVAPDGAVGLCHAFLGNRKTFAGNVRDERFFPEQDPNWKEWSLRSPLNMPQCRHCECLGICGGGCPANNADNIWEVESGFCAHARTVLEWLIWDLLDQTRMQDSNHVIDAFIQADSLPVPQ